MNRLNRLLRLWIGIATLFAVSVASAATVGERRALQPGIWWDARHPGHGFELQQIRDQLFLLWYTYGEFGEPIWYAAQAPMGDEQEIQADLLRHRWENGRIADSTVVGAVKLLLRSRESAQVDWQLGGRSGSWQIKPFEVDGVLPEVNHSGLWYQADRPGYGLSVMEQGQVLIAAMFMYDQTGQPTWRFGNANDGARTVPLNAFKGHCPGCITSLEINGAALDLELHLGEAESQLAFALREPESSGPWTTDGAALQQLSPTFSERAADWQLASFESDAALKRYLETANEQRQQPYSTIEFSTSPPAPARSFAPTNVQEDGVDEADLVKTDGRYVYTYAMTEWGQVRPQLRIAEVENQGLRVLSPVGLEGTGTSSAATSGLYLTDQQLVTVTSTEPYATPSAPAVWTDLYAWKNGQTQVQIFDRSNPAAPQKLWGAVLDGHLVASRRIGSQLYLVQRASVAIPEIYIAPQNQAQRAHNRQIFDSTTLSQMVPHASFDGAAVEPLVSAQRTYLPPTGDASLQPEFVTVTRINLDNPTQRETVAVLGRVAAVYVSSQHLYLASSRYDYIPAFNGFIAPGFSKTDVHQIALRDSGLQVVGTGTVEGYLDRDPDRAPLRFAEIDGRLNLVTVSPFMWGELGQNRLTVLQPSRIQPGLLATRAILPNKARPQALGKPGEMLYATRFVGDRLYAVTFQTTDPLYTVDLSSPEDPFIRGALEIPGFSDYLHPLPNGLLLGLGMDARDAGGFAWFQGLQLSLFDVNGNAPRELQRIVVGKRGSYSAALRNHRGFADLALPGMRMIALPAQVHDTDASVPSNVPDHHVYPHAYSGLLRYALIGDTAANATLTQLPTLISRPKSQTAPGIDDAQVNGRPVLFDHGAAYVDRGRFFWISNSGGQAGPL